MNLCKTFLVGRCTKDPELKYTPGENSVPVATVDLAVETGYGNNKHANYFHIKGYRKNAENMNKYWIKGKKVILSCTPTQSRWKTKDGKSAERLEFIVDSWEFAESRAAQQGHGGSKDSSDGLSFMDIPDDIESELPFV